jgi:tellurite resistance protein TerC
VHKFVYLKYGLSMVLVFVGGKMMLLDVVKVPTAVSLAVIATLIGGSIAASLWTARGRAAAAAVPAPASR